MAVKHCWDRQQRSNLSAGRCKNATAILVDCSRSHASAASVKRCQQQWSCTTRLSDAAQIQRFCRILSLHKVNLQSIYNNHRNRFLIIRGSLLWVTVMAMGDYLACGSLPAGLKCHVFNFTYELAVNLHRLTFTLTTRVNSHMWLCTIYDSTITIILVITVIVVIIIFYCPR